MNMVIPNEGKEKLIEWAFISDGTGLPDFVLQLFKNDYTPVDGSTAADFTAADFTGYVLQTLLRANFSGPFLASNVAFVDYDPVPEFECTGGAAQVVYGWWLVTDDDNTVIAAQRFDTPRNMTPGSTETLDPFRIKSKTLD